MKTVTVKRRDLEKLEWSGSMLGQGNGYMGSGRDGRRYPACPVCGQLKEPNPEFIKIAVGHIPACWLGNALASSMVKKP